MITPSFGLTATERVLPKLALDFTTASLDPRVTFTRTTDASNPATYFDSNGYIALATNNQPRFDYNPVTLVCRGLLIEESRSNILLKSNDFTDSATWSPTTVTVTPNAITSPDGTLSGTKLQSNSSGARVTQTVTASVTGQHTFTVFCKYGNSTLQRVSVYNLTTSTFIGNIQFNVQTGNIQATVAGSGVTSPAGNGWFRLGVVCSDITAGQQIIAYVYAGDSSNPAGTFCYAWGAQLEAGAFATSYIPTTGSAATRNADVATMTGTNFSDWWNNAEGTWKAKYNLEGLSSAYVVSTGVNRFALRVGGGISGYRRSPTNVDFGPTNTTVNSDLTFCESLKSGDSAIAVNGGTPTTSAAAITMAETVLYIGCLVTGNSTMSGWVKQIEYWPQKLTTNEVKAFSK